MRGIRNSGTSKESVVREERKQTTNGRTVGYTICALIVLALVYICTVPGPGLAQQAVEDTIRVTYKFAAPEITQVGEYHSVTIEGLPKLQDPGLPMLPIKGASILIPFGKRAKVEELRVICGNKVEIEGKFVVEPGQEPVPIGYTGPVTPTLPSPEVYGSSEPFPGVLRSEVSVQRRRGQEILVFTLYPVQYIPQEGKLSYYEDLTVEVDLEDTIRVTYKFAAPEIAQVGEYHSVTIEGLPKLQEPGLPMLPIKTVSILIPFGKRANVEGVEVISGNKVDIEGEYVVEPGQEPVPIGYTGPVTPTLPSPEVYGSSEPFPGVLRSEVSVQRKRGHEILVLTLYPVQYIPQEGKLSYYEDLTVEVDLEDTISVTYKFAAPEITPVGEYHSVTIEGLPKLQEPGLPMLPIKTVSILIPFGKRANVEELRVICGNKVEIEGKFVVEPGQEPVPIGYTGPVTPTLPSPEVYGSSEPFPGVLRSEVSVQRRRGQEILVFTLYPVQYIPQEGKLSYYEDLTIEVDLEDTIRVTYKFAAPEITQVGEYHSVTIEGLPKLQEPGLPMLPIKTVSILIPFGKRANVEGLRVICGNKVEIEGEYVVEPGQEPVPIGYTGPVTPTLPSPEVYGSSEPFPGVLRSEVSVQRRSGHEILVLTLYPVQYILQEGKLSYYEDLTVEVYLKDSYQIYLPSMKNDRQ